MINEITWEYMHHIYHASEKDEFQDYLDYVNFQEEEVFDEE